MDVNADSGSSRVPVRPKRQWSNEEDAVLIQVLLELHGTGKFKADRGFKPGLFSTVEKELDKRLPGCGIKADPHIYSRMKTLKTHFSIVHDMVHGNSTSGFGWDAVTKTVIAENAVWDAYLKSHKNAAQFKEKSFKYYDELAVIFGVDRAHGQASVDCTCAEEMANITEEQVDEVEENNCDQISMSTTQLRTEKNSQNDQPNIRKRKTKMEDMEMLEVLKCNTILMVDAFKSTTTEICNAIKHVEVMNHRIVLNNELLKIAGLSYLDRLKAYQYLGSSKDQLELFFSMNPEDREQWVISIVNGLV